MRIKEINIQRYGPLPKTSLQIGEGIQLIYGSNESGKTLLIDAIIRKLVGEQPLSGWSVQRVSEVPEGYIILDDDGKEINLQKENTLATYLDKVGADELRNIFVIRDADLRLADQDSFFEKTQDRIVGLRSDDIRRIKNQLRDQGRLQPTQLELADSQGHYKARSQFKEAVSLTEDIREYLEKAQQDGTQAFEADLFDANSTKNDLEKKLKILEEAKKKKSFEILEKALKSAKTGQNTLNKTPQSSIEMLNRKFGVFEEKEQNKAHLMRTQGFLKIPSVLFLIIVAFLMFSYPDFGTGNFLIQMITILCLLLSSVLILLWFNASRNLSKIETEEKIVLSEAKKSGIEISNIEDLRKKLQEKEDQINTLQRKINQNIGVLGKDLEIDTENIDEVIKAAEIKLDKMRPDVDFTIQERYRDSKYNSVRTKLEQTQNNIDDLNEKLRLHKDALNDFATRTYKLNFQHFLKTNLDLQIENLSSLQDLLPKLEEFKKKLENDRNLAIQALGIFDTLESEEEAKVSDLFKKGNLAAKFFKKITKGRYTDIEYDSDEGKILVKTASKKTFRVHELSKGATDQLYLSIRLALGEKILQGKKGFFIMDDAFISSDDSRFERQSNIIKEIAKKKWQILYLTAKKQTLNKLQKLTENKPIYLKPLA